MKQVNICQYLSFTVTESLRVQKPSQRTSSLKSRFTVTESLRVQKRKN